MIAGPYRSGSDDPAVWAANLRVLNEAALALHRMGHVPVIGVNMALPLIAAGDDPAAHDAIMLPLSLALAERCDACLRIGGASHGADAEVARFTARGLPVWRSLADVAPA